MLVSLCPGGTRKPSLRRFSPPCPAPHFPKESASGPRGACSAPSCALLPCPYPSGPDLLGAVLTAHARLLCSLTHSPPRASGDVPSRHCCAPCPAVPRPAPQTCRAQTCPPNVQSTDLPPTRRLPQPTRPASSLMGSMCSGSRLGGAEGGSCTLPLFRGWGGQEVDG